MLRSHVRREPLLEITREAPRTNAATAAVAREDLPSALSQKPILGLMSSRIAIERTIMTDIIAACAAIRNAAETSGRRNEHFMASRFPKTPGDGSWFEFADKDGVLDFAHALVVGRGEGLPVEEHGGGFPAVEIVRGPAAESLHDRRQFGESGAFAAAGESAVHDNETIMAGREISDSRCEDVVAAGIWNARVSP